VGNFAYAAVISLAGRITVSVVLGIVLGLAPALILWRKAPDGSLDTVKVEAKGELEVLPLSALHK